MSVQRPTGDQSPVWVRAASITAAFVALLWVLELVDTLDHHRLDAYGISPRSEQGLRGILFAPLLHAGWGHLEGNTVPVLVLGFLVLLSGIRRGLITTAVIWLVAGVGVWLVAPDNTLHLGASVLVFGWLVHLVVRGIFSHRPGQIVLGIVLFLGYGGLLLGVLPGQPGVSWQGHLFGAVGGALAAVLVSPRRRSVARSGARLS